MNDMTDNVIACLTPPGKGGIASLAIRGPDAWITAQKLFHTSSGKQVASPPRQDAVYVGKLKLPEGADDVVLAVTSLAPFATLEVHCHGGNEVVRGILQLFREKGFQPVEWTTLDEARGSLLARLAQAPTLRTASILLVQAQGAYERMLEDMKDNPGRAEAMGRRFLGFGSFARHLVKPWQILIAGAPNVGKSSLVNAIVGYQRSIVSPLPGTTRDLVSTVLAIDGWPVELWDSAGLRFSADELEAAGMDHAQAAMKRADLVIWVNAADMELQWPTDMPSSTLRVMNKIDLAPERPWESGIAYVSAQTGAGIPELLELVSSTLVPECPAAGEAVPLEEIQIEEIEKRLNLARGE